MGEGAGRAVEPHLPVRQPCARGAAPICGRARRPVRSRGVSARVPGSGGVPRAALPAVLAAAAALLFSAVVYGPLTRNYFFSDDFLNLYYIANDSLLQYLLTPNGGHLLVARNAVFYAMRALFGLRPELFFAAVLLTHLVNVWLLFRLVRLLTGRVRLASFGAAAWGISPLNEGSLGWYAVYGHVMVATALLVILCQAAVLARDGRQPGGAQRALWWALALVAVTSFGTGIAIALVLPVVLLLLLPAAPDGRRWRWPPLGGLVVVIPLLYVVLTWLYLRVSGDTTLLRTPVGALFSDPVAIVVVWLRLLAYGLVRLLSGYAPAFGQPLWYALLAALVVAALVAARRAPAAGRRILAMALLAAAAYGVIAVGRAAILLDRAPQLIETLTRYHYVGQLALIVALCLVLAATLPRLGGWAWGLLGAWYAAAFAAWLLLAPPIDHHDAARQATREVLAAIGRAARARPPGEAVYIRNRGFRALPFFQEQFPGWAAVFVGFHPRNAVAGRPVYFVDPDPRVLAGAARGRRTATLIVPAAPPGVDVVAPPVRPVRPAQK